MSQIYSPVVIYPFWTPANQSLEVFVTSDRWETVDGTAQLTWFDWNGKQLGASTSHRFTTPPLNNSLILSATGFENILPKGVNETDSWLLLNLTAQTSSGTVTNEQYVSRQHPIRLLIRLILGDSLPQHLSPTQISLIPK